MSSWDSRCDVCGEIELFPVRCKQCGGVYCSTHMPPEKHRCHVHIKRAQKRAAGRLAGPTLSPSQTRKLVQGGMLLLACLLIAGLLYFSMAAFSGYPASAGQDPIIGIWNSYDGFTGKATGDSITFRKDGTFYAEKYLTTSFDNPYISDVCGNWTRGDDSSYILTWRTAGTGTGNGQLPETLSYVSYRSDTGTLVFTERASLRSTGLFPSTTIFKKA